MSQESTILIRGSNDSFPPGTIIWLQEHPYIVTKHDRLYGNASLTVRSLRWWEWCWIEIKARVCGLCQWIKSKLIHEPKDCSER